MRASRRLSGIVAGTLLAGMVIVAPTYAATIRHVPADYATISLALAASSSGDTVLVAPGTYVDNFTVPAGVTVESSGGPETTSVRGVNFAGPIAIINGGGTVRGLTLHDSGGNVSGGAAQVAGLLEDSRILDNSACFEASAIMLDGGTVQDSYFEGNASNCFSPPVITGDGSVLDNEFADNGHSPPIRISDDDMTVERNSFHDPGIVWQLWGSSNPVIRNNLVVATGEASGGGLIDLQLGSTGSPTQAIVNNTLVLSSGNGPLVSSGGDDASLTFANNILVGQAGSTLLKCDQDLGETVADAISNDFWTPAGAGTTLACAGLVGTSGNVSVDPKFVSSATGDYHLRAYSTLIDAGVNSGAPSTDYDGDARPLDGNENGAAVVDIGFDETTLALGISPDAKDFGDVALGRPVTQSITATNLGAAPITIDTIGLETDGDFEIVSETCPAGTLAVAAACTIQVRFTPSEFGAATATLTVGGPGSTGSLDIPLEGNGVHPLTADNYFFQYPSAIVGIAIPGSITISNAGPPQTISGIAVTGTNAGDVTIGAQTCTSAPIPMDGSCVIPFTYRALGDGGRNAIIDISAPILPGGWQIPISANANFATSNVTWGSTTGAGPSYTWNGGGALGRTVQSGAQRLHLAYATNRVNAKWATDSGPKVGVYYIRNTSGTTWSTPLRLNPTTQHASTLGLAASGSRVYAIWVSQTRWVSYSPTAPRALYVRVNTSHGAATSWRSTVALTSTTGRVDYPAIAAAGTDAHVAWTDAVTGAIRVASSRDYGVTWSKASLGTTAITFSDGRTGFPTVAANGSTVAVCWLSDVAGTVKCRVSTNRGVSWGTATTVGTQANGFFSVAVRGNRIAVVWATPGIELVLRQRIGGVWTAAKVIPVGFTPNEFYGPHVELQDTNRVAVGWSADHGSETILWWGESPNGGSLWFAPQVISASVSSRLRNDWPSVVWASAGTRYLVWNGWTENTASYKLYLRKGTGTPTTPTSAALDWKASDAAVTVLDPAVTRSSTGP